MKLRSSLVALGLGAAAYHYATRNDMFSRKNIKKARKMLKSYL